MPGGHGGPVPPEAAAYVRTALYDATHHVFIALAVLAVLALCALLLMPRRSSKLTIE
ncbi:hypothetical protein [Micromonospora sp. S4605]|uniref:hypothetical protein n=1 Tax=Micromonospora sp. S4605 TaxID=1420897 RepID=UPI0013053656|nr:hypothetical protein [Micromonospora sp. S4605]